MRFGGRRRGCSSSLSSGQRVAQEAVIDSAFSSGRITLLVETWYLIDCPKCSSGEGNRDASQ